MDESQAVDPTLKEKVITSGGILTFRNITAMLISAAGNIIIVRFLGLELYGLQTVSLFFVSLLGTVSDLNVSLYLLRKPGELTEQQIRVGYTLMICFSLVCVCIAVFALAPAVSWWYGRDELFWLLACSSLGILISSFGQISRVLIERDMGYRKISFIEIIGMLGYYVPVVVGVLLGLKVWALILGEVCRPIISSILARKMKPVSIPFTFDRKISKEILRFGFPISLSGWIWMISGAVNPILISKTIGLESAGIVRLVQGIANQFSFFSSVVSRLSLNIFGKIQNEPERVLRAINQSALFNYFLITLPTLLFASIGYWAIPLLYGDQSVPAASFIVVALLSNSINLIFAGQTYVLMTIGLSKELIKLHLIRTPLLWGLCFAMVPALGYFALPVAETISLIALYILHKNVKAIYGKPRYADALLLLVLGYGSMVVGWMTKMPPVSILILLLGNGLAFLLISAEAKKSLMEIVRSILKFAPFRLVQARVEP